MPCRAAHDVMYARPRAVKFGVPSTLNPHRPRATHAILYRMVWFFVFIFVSDGESADPVFRIWVSFHALDNPDQDMGGSDDCKPLKGFFANGNGP